MRAAARTGFPRGAVVALAFALLLPACGEAQLPTQDVVNVIPWRDGEEAHYRLEDRDGADKGRGTLRVDQESDHFRLTLEFGDNSNSDESVELVDAQTLKPFSLRREIRSSEQTDTIEAEYLGDQVRIRATSNGDVRQSFLRIPEHSYDNDSSLFLWRTMPLAPDYTARYTTVVTNRREKRAVTVRVSGPEEVEVPAGAFSAWRVEVRSGGVRQLAWYSADQRRLLLKYDNSRLLFLLEEVTGGG